MRIVVVADNRTNGSIMVGNLDADTPENIEKLKKEHMETIERQKGKGTPEKNAASGPGINPLSTCVCGWPAWAVPKTATKINMHKYCQFVFMCYWMCVSILKIMCGPRYSTTATFEVEVRHTEQPPSMRVP